MTDPEPLLPLCGCVEIAVQYCLLRYVGAGGIEWCMGQSCTSFVLATAHDCSAQQTHRIESS